MSDMPKTIHAFPWAGGFGSGQWLGVSLAGHHTTAEYTRSDLCITTEALARVRQLAFGRGEQVVTVGEAHGVPAVFIAPAKQPGAVGSDATREGNPRDMLVPGEIVMTFPTPEQAQIVADALVNATADTILALAPDATAAYDRAILKAREGALTEARKAIASVQGWSPYPFGTAKHEAWLKGAIDYAERAHDVLRALIAIQEPSQ